MFWKSWLRGRILLKGWRRKGEWERVEMEVRRRRKGGRGRSILCIGLQGQADLEMKQTA